MPRARGAATAGTLRAALVRRIITSESVPRPPIVSACCRSIGQQSELAAPIDHLREQKAHEDRSEQAIAALLGRRQKQRARPHGEQQRKQTAGGGEQQPRVRHDGHDPRRHPGAQQERELAASESGQKETRHDGLRIAEQHLMAVPA